MRLTLVNNHGDPKYSELSGFRGYGRKPSPRRLRWRRSPARTPPTTTIPPAPAGDGDLRLLRAQRRACSRGRSRDGWRRSPGARTEGKKRGPAVFVFAPDGKSLPGYWWYDSDKGRKVDGDWSGKRGQRGDGELPALVGLGGGRAAEGPRHERPGAPLRHPLRHGLRPHSRRVLPDARRGGAGALGGSLLVPDHRGPHRFDGNAGAQPGALRAAGEVGPGAISPARASLPGA